MTFWCGTNSQRLHPHQEKLLVSISFPPLLLTSSLSFLLLLWLFSLLPCSAAWVSREGCCTMLDTWMEFKLSHKQWVTKLTNFVCEIDGIIFQVRSGIRLKLMEWSWLVLKWAFYKSTGICGSGQAGNSNSLSNPMCKSPSIHPDLFPTWNILILLPSFLPGFKWKPTVLSSIGFWAVVLKTGLALQPSPSCCFVTKSQRTKTCCGIYLYLHPKAYVLYHLLYSKWDHNFTLH